MRWSFWVAWILLLAGAILIRLPIEEDSYIPYHDSFTLPLHTLAGIALLILTGTWMIIKIIQRRQDVWKRLTGKGVLLAVLCMVTGMLAGLEGLLNNDSRLGWTGTVLVIIGFFTLTYSSFQKTIE